MMVFHLAFDLNHFGWLQPPHRFNQDPLWTLQRSAIVSLFLLCAGVGQAVAMQRVAGWPRFWRRWAQVVAGAAAVSIGSALMFPDSWISFGVLHGMAVMLLLARLAAPLGRWLWPSGAVALALPLLVAHPLFDHRWSNWVGLVTRKPVTEDYVPLLPWLGVMLFGVAAGQWLLARHPAWLSGPLPGAGFPVSRLLAWLGRWPLTVYLIHQPIFIGLLMGLQAAGLLAVR